MKWITLIIFLFQFDIQGTRVGDVKKSLDLNVEEGLASLPTLSHRIKNFYKEKGISKGPSKLGQKTYYLINSNIIFHLKYKQGI